ncbi:hypothetical protein ZWY2020_033662 [Hordeum vulgare]|nr:hypothetical protein ZWY2020_033662 [Hordeum vulgare]
MHRIFRNTLFPRIGNKDEVHGLLAEMLLLCEEARNKATAPLDISDVMFCELWNCIMNRKVPIYGPYLFAFIQKKWKDTYPDELLPVEADYFVHDPIKLRLKNKWANTSTSSQPMDTDTEIAAGGGPSSHTRSSTMPSCTMKQKDQMKTLFCMQAKGHYHFHVAQNENCQRHKRVLRTLDVATLSGSEDDITPETDWMRAQGYKWNGSDADEEVSDEDIEEEQDEQDPDATDESEDEE